MTAETREISGTGSAAEVLGVFLRLGLTSFGGPVAHLGYFRTEFVQRRRWLDEATYADIVALCQFLPGPASSQVGMALGLRRAGLAGALAAWLGFTLPSALLMLLFALGLDRIGLDRPWAAAALHGLKIAAAAVVAQALWAMARSLTPDAPRATIAVAAAAVALLLPGAAAQVGALALAALAGWQLLPRAGGGTAGPPVPMGRGLPWLVLFALLLALLPLAGAAGEAGLLGAAMVRAGALVFGGGHVVLPLLEAELVAPGWVSADSFLAGYGVAQAVPGPLFSFAAYLGAVAGIGPGGAAGAALALVAIYVPSFLLVLGTLPSWSRLRGVPALQAALAGVNAAVVGLLAAAFYDPVWTAAITGPADMALLLAAGVMLVSWRVPPWAVVPITAVIAQIPALL